MLCRGVYLGMDRRACNEQDNRAKNLKKERNLDASERISTDFPLVFHADLSTCASCAEVTFARRSRVCSLTSLCCAV
jgi:hypothetical protein